MEQVDFSDRRGAEKRFGDFSHETRFAAACRATLRIVPILGQNGTIGDKEILLHVMRSLLLASLLGHETRSTYRLLFQKFPYATRANVWKDRSPEFNRTTGILRSALYSYAEPFEAIITAINAIEGSSQSSLTPSTIKNGWFTRTSLGEAAENLASQDLSGPEDTSLSTRLWRDRAMPHSLNTQHIEFQGALNDDIETWRFWHDWYLGMWNGTFTDWDLAIEVAKIPNEIWGQGAEAVAARIREIQDEMDKALPHPENVPELEREKLLLHVRRLLSAPEMTALAAEGAAATLRQAIKQYLDTAPANCLPDQLAHLDGLPPLFDGISQIVKSSDRAEAKEMRLADQIEALNAQVEQLEAELRRARSKSVHGLFKESMVKAMGASFGASVIASVSLGTAHFFGAWPDDFTLENLRGFLSDVETATPKASEPNMLPPATDT